MILDGGNSLTGAKVRGSSCQDTRRGRGENANTSNATDSTAVELGE